MTANQTAIVTVTRAPLLGVCSLTTCSDIASHLVTALPGDPLASVVAACTADAAEVERQVGELLAGRAAPSLPDDLPLRANARRYTSRLTVKGAA